MGFYIHLPWELLCYGKEPCLMPNGFFTAKLCTKATVCRWQTVFWEPGWFCACDVGEKQKGFRPRALTFSKTTCRSGGSVWKSRATVCPLACLEGSDVTCFPHMWALCKCYTCLFLTFHLRFDFRWYPKLGSNSDCKSDFTVR